jgi:hypothetical protein
VERLGARSQSAPLPLPPPPPAPPPQSPPSPPASSLSLLVQRPASPVSRALYDLASQAPDVCAYAPKSASHTSSVSRALYALASQAEDAAVGFETTVSNSEEEGGGGQVERSKTVAGPSSQPPPQPPAPAHVHSEPADLILAAVLADARAAEHSEYEAYY